MKIFRKGADTPPLFLEVMNPWGTIQFWSQKEEEKNFPQHTQNDYI